MHSKPTTTDTPAARAALRIRARGAASIDGAPLAAGGAGGAIGSAP